MDGGTLPPGGWPPPPEPSRASRMALSTGGPAGARPPGGMANSWPAMRLMASATASRADELREMTVAACPPPGFTVVRALAIAPRGLVTCLLLSPHQHGLFFTVGDGQEILHAGFQESHGYGGPVGNFSGPSMGSPAAVEPETEPLGIGEGTAEVGAIGPGVASGDVAGRLKFFFTLSQ